MTTQRIDFAVVKDQASFSTILHHYGIKHRSSRGQASVLCPFHDDQHPSLSVNFTDNLFHCFSCEAKGSILDFVARMEEVSILEAARMITVWCGIAVNGDSSVERLPKDGAEEVNKPLGFTLNLDPRHPYLFDRGLTPEVIKTFGLGYCSTGLLQGRIAIPIFDAKNTLVAYAGRWASGEIPEGIQKYLLPRGFRKSAVLFNFHRVANVKHLVIVEGYWSVFRLHHLGVAAIALMGRTLSNEQEQLLLKSNVRLLKLLLDADEPGRKATEELLPRLSQQFFVRVPTLPDNEAPDTVDEDLLTAAVGL